MVSTEQQHAKVVHQSTSVSSYFVVGKERRPTVVAWWVWLIGKTRKEPWWRLESHEWWLAPKSRVRVFMYLSGKGRKEGDMFKPHLQIKLLSQNTLLVPPLHIFFK